MSSDPESAPRSKKGCFICFGLTVVLILAALIIIPYFLTDISKGKPAKSTKPNINTLSPKPQTSPPATPLTDNIPAHSAPVVSDDEARISFEAGMDYYKRSRHEDAIAEFTKAIEGMPHDYKAYFYRGSVYLDQKEFDRAVQDLTRAIELKPDYQKAYLYRGMAYDAKDAFDLSIKDYTKAISLKPKNEDAYYYRGFARERSGDYDGAIKDYERSLQINPKFRTPREKLEELRKKDK
ncbi:MAG TPA: tetratricopeptide repeat protein [Thermodesulfovibrionales bacterium]|nr:tetratricopeptide repeat protein [Thermodesulfovibrionales bacterium]